MYVKRTGRSMRMGNWTKLRPFSIFSPTRLRNQKFQLTQYTIITGWKLEILQHLLNYNPLLLQLLHVCLLSTNSHIFVRLIS